MLTPEYLTRIVEATQEKVSEVNSYLTARIAKRIKGLFENTGKVDISPSSISDIKKQISAGRVYEEVQSEIEKKLPGIQREVKRAFYDAAGKISYDNTVFTEKVVEIEQEQGNLLDIELPKATKLERIGIPEDASKLNMTPKEIRVLESAYRRTNGEIYNLTRTCAGEAQRDFIEACDRAFFRVKRGVSIDTAIMDAINEVASKGITTVHYGRRNDSIESAIARAVRTGVNQANGDIVLTRCAEMGVNHVLVSQHVGARVTDRDDFTNHSLWQGKVYRVYWSNPVLSQYEPTLQEIQENNSSFAFLDKIKSFFKTKDNGKQYKDFIAECGYGQMLGICGINCRHSFGAFYPGVNINTNKHINQKLNEEKYNLEQKQRGMERAIRKTKRIKYALQSSGIRGDEYNNRVYDINALLRKQTEAYEKFCDKYADMGISPINWRLKVAKTEGVSNI